MYPLGTVVPPVVAGPGTGVIRLDGILSTEKKNKRSKQKMERKGTLWGWFEV